MRSIYVYICVCLCVQTCRYTSISGSFMTHTKESVVVSIIGTATAVALLSSIELQNSL